MPVNYKLPVWQAQKKSLIGIAVALACEMFSFKVIKISHSWKRMIEDRRVFDWLTSFDGLIKQLRSKNICQPQNILPLFQNDELLQLMKKKILRQNFGWLFASVVQKACISS